MKTVFRLTCSPACLFTGVALLAALRLPARTAVIEPFELKDGDRVLFIGDTFFEREGDYGHIETRLTARYPDRHITFRNLAWAGDTPMGRARASFDWNKPEEEWLKRVKEQLALVKPTVAFLSYGMTAALEAANAKTTGEQQTEIEKFKADMNKLMDAIDEVSGRKVRFVLLGPIAHEAWLPEATARNQILKLYEQATGQLAGKRQAIFVGLRWLWPEGEKERGFKHKRTDDGIHLNQLGYELVAGSIEHTLLGGSKAMSGGPYENLRRAILKKNELFFHRWRPANWTYLLGFRKQEQGQNAVELPKFDPLIEEWEGRIAKLRDLKRQDPAAVKVVRSLFEVRSSMFDVSGSRTNIEHSTSNAEHRIASQPLPTFEVAEGFEVNLWAEDPLLHKPIEINWDAQGRLWVASSEVYPQIKPGQPATDSVVVLEDAAGDGKADKSSVFAGGLLIPTGVLPDSNGGCYVAASHQLLYFKDTNGDGKSDEKRIVLSSFGTEDTHHNLHTLRWGFDGHIYMNQSIYTHSHIETPHGNARLNSAGIWRFDPGTYRLEVFTRGGCNPWGHAWDDYGNSFFTDGAGFQGVSYCVPGAMYFTYAGARRELQSISPGNYPKFASLEVVRSPQFPDDWQGDFITCDFRAHRVVHFKYSEAGAGFQTKEMPDLLRSTNVTFRPIDVKFGPDGALYVADWSNPIIQHGEVDFRDPRRDKEHGRIWRVAAKGRPAAKKVNLTKMGIPELLDRTLSKNGWEQEQARRLLRLREAGRVFLELKQWLAKQTDPRAPLESLWLHDAFAQPDNELIQRIASAPDERLRTAAARQLSR
jgi:glucose/arabinose dehydrogenase/lysophospholipase L1-like esterase